MLKMYLDVFITTHLYLFSYWIKWKFHNMFLKPIIFVHFGELSKTALDPWFLAKMIDTDTWIENLPEY